MTDYRPPSIEKLKALLADAGAELSRQVVGAYWISSALRGVGRSATPADAAEKVRTVRKHVEGAVKAFEQLSALDKEWLSNKVGEPLGNALNMLDLVLQVSPGGHRELGAHARFASHLVRYLKSEGYPVKISENSLLVRIFALCVGMDEESAKTTLRRLKKGNKIQLS